MFQLVCLSVCPVCLSVSMHEHQEKMDFILSVKAQFLVRTQVIKLIMTHECLIGLNDVVVLSYTQRVKGHLDYKIINQFVFF